jgi:hypothetical protein
MRPEGWEARLAAVVEAYRARPYVLGVSDCLRFACAAIEAVSGEAHWHLFAGRYTTRAEALRTLRAWGRSWTQAFTAFFGSEPAPAATARRGDVLTFDAGSERHLGVCVGAEVALYTETGLAFVPLSDARLIEAWRVG